MSYSLNEIDALCRKAARGAGHAWGLAEEAGRAVRWLQARGIAAAGGLLSTLQSAKVSRTVDMPGHSLQGDGPLCPIVAGATLSDHAALLRAQPIVLLDICHPVLLAPFAAAAALQLGQALRLDWDGAEITLEPDPRITGDPAAVATPLAALVTCTLSDDPISPPADPPCSRAALDPETYAGLEALAGRTYAPATEASRAAGAGAGMTDND